MRNILMLWCFQIQADAGLDAIIVDDVQLIAKSLNGN